MKQTVLPSEIIIVDDGSEDATISKAKEFKNNVQGIPIRILSQLHKGAQAARNLGIKEAVGDYIAFNDSDDIWLPDKLEKQRNAMEESMYPVCAGGSIRDFCNGSWEYSYINGSSGFILKEICSYQTYILFPSLIVKKSILEEIGFLDESAIAFQELETSIRIAERYPIAYCNTALFIYKLHDGERIGTQKNSGRALEYIVKKHEELFISNVGYAGCSWIYRMAAWNFLREEKNVRGFARNRLKAFRLSLTGNAQKCNIPMMINPKGN